jgi:tetratricopeptide (TPR) repeat protein
MPLVAESGGLAILPGMTAIVVLGMHRSGTSCLAGMLAAAGVAAAGTSVRNWDNARGHFEALAAVRLNEAVLAHSGGHWLSPPSALRWTDEHAAERDRLLQEPINGLPALLKDPRTLLCLSFWRATTVPFQTIGIVRHPLAVARSLEAWRGTSLAEGVALWLAHNRILAADVQMAGYPLIDFERCKADVVDAVYAACQRFGWTVERERLNDAYAENLVHHDPDEAPAIPDLDAAVALYQAMTGSGSRERRRAFPRAAVAQAQMYVAEGNLTAAITAAEAALAASADPVAVLAPLVSAFLRRRAFTAAHQLIDYQRERLADDVAHLLRGKVLLASGDSGSAAVELTAACAVPEPYFQARHLLPHALREAGRRAEACVALAVAARMALYPHGPLATLAEWHWLDGDQISALSQLAEAITAAPHHRRGRLRTRRAEWLRERGAVAEARRELAQALVEDPAYTRAAEVLASLP